MTSGNKPQFKTVDEYIVSQAVEIRVILENIRGIIKETAPDAKEAISYQMPAFKYHGMLVWYAAFKKHYSIFFYPNVLEKFSKELKGFDLAKAGIKIPYNKTISDELLVAMVKYAVNENYSAMQLKNASTTLSDRSGSGSATKRSKTPLF